MIIEGHDLSLIVNREYLQFDAPAPVVWVGYLLLIVSVWHAEKGSIEQVGVYGHDIRDKLPHRLRKRSNLNVVQSDVKKSYRNKW